MAGWVAGWVGGWAEGWVDRWADGWARGKTRGVYGSSSLGGGITLSFTSPEKEKHFFIFKM